MSSSHTWLSLSPSVTHTLSASHTCLFLSPSVMSVSLCNACCLPLSLRYMMGVASLSVSPPDTDSARYHLEVARDMMDKIRGECPKEVTELIPHFHITLLSICLLPNDSLPLHVHVHTTSPSSSISMHVSICLFLPLLYLSSLWSTLLPSSL